MSGSKPQNPYTRLKETARQFIAKHQHPERRKMLLYSPRQDAGYTLTDLKERIAAGRQLGYRTEAEVTEDGKIQFYYVKKPPEFMPWELR